MSQTVHPHPPTSQPIHLTLQCHTQPAHILRHNPAHPQPQTSPPAHPHPHTHPPSLSGVPQSTLTFGCHSQSTSPSGVTQPTLTLRHHSRPTPSLLPGLPETGRHGLPQSKTPPRPPPHSRDLVVHVSNIYSVQEPACSVACVVMANPNLGQGPQVNGIDGEGVCL